jgi:hypothetical protein
MTIFKNTLLVALASATAAFSPATADALKGGRHSGEIIVYEHPNFRGQSRVFDGVVRDLNYFRFNDTISSLELRGKWEVCEHPNFRGRCQLVTGPIAHLSDIRMNDNITSMRPISHRGDRPRRDRRPRSEGVQGPATVFFPRPRDAYGDRIPAQRGNAREFCRDMGYRGVAYANFDRRNLTDVLCKK